MSLLLLIILKRRKCACAGVSALPFSDSIAPCLAWRWVVGGWGWGVGGVIFQNIIHLTSSFKIFARLHYRREHESCTDCLTRNKTVCWLAVLRACVVDDNHELRAFDACNPLGEARKGYFNIITNYLNIITNYIVNNCVFLTLGHNGLLASKA